MNYGKLFDASFAVCPDGPNNPFYSETMLIDEYN
jgi:hypothetical protein